MKPVGRVLVAGGVLAVLVTTPPACSDQPTDPSRISDSSHEPEPFDGEIRCPAGEQVGAVAWDYGANPKGRIEDPVRWVRNNAVGLDPELALSFVEKFRGHADTLDNVVFVKNDDGLVVAFIEFGRDDEGRYFPNAAEVCASAGIEDFT
jgi:hypothetical protein